LVFTEKVTLNAPQPGAIATPGALCANAGEAIRNNKRMVLIEAPSQDGVDLAANIPTEIVDVPLSGCVASLRSALHPQFAIWISSSHIVRFSHPGHNGFAITIRAIRTGLSGIPKANS
jgi:hypothetical protein